MHFTNPHAFLVAVRTRIDARLESLDPPAPGRMGAGPSVSSDRLCCRFVAHLAATNLPGFDTGTALATCVAAELMYTASLHGDGVANAADHRRARLLDQRPVAVIGARQMAERLRDEALAALGSAPAARAQLTEVLDAARAAEGEHADRRPISVDALARWEADCRRDTGAIFAFTARWAFTDQALAGALEEAGALIGAAWQMLDDVLHFSGVPRVLGGRSKTGVAGRAVAWGPFAGTDEALERIEGVLARACAQVTAWPDVQRAVSGYIAREMQPLMDGLFAPGPFYAIA